MAKDQYGREIDAHGRAVEEPVDLQPIIDEKVGALTKTLRRIEKQDADALAAFPPAGGKVAKSAK